MLKRCTEFVELLFLFFHIIYVRENTPFEKSEGCNLTSYTDSQLCSLRGVMYVNTVLFMQKFLIPLSFFVNIIEILFIIVIDIEYKDTCLQNM